MGEHKIPKELRQKPPFVAEPKTKRRGAFETVTPAGYLGCSQRVMKRALDRDRRKEMRRESERKALVARSKTDPTDRRAARAARSEAKRIAAQRLGFGATPAVAAPGNGAS